MIGGVALCGLAGDRDVGELGGEQSAEIRVGAEHSQGDIHGVRALDGEQRDTIFGIFAEGIAGSTSGPKATVGETMLALRMRPMRPPRSMRCARSTAALPRSCKPMAVWTPAAFAAPASCCVSEVLVPSGHSQYTCLPAAMAERTRSAWSGTLTATVTIATAGSAIRSCPEP